MDASQILEDQVIHIKRGRTNQFGFEPAWNAYFDFYLSPKYIAPPLLQLEDVTFHLFLLKNLNDQNPQWRMPTVRQMKRRLHVSQDKLEGMMRRLDGAHLLKKVSGYRAGDEGENIPNHYILSDPLQTLDEFLAVAAAGLFPRPLQEEWQEFVETDPCTENRYTLYRNPVHPPVPDSGTYKQTLTTKQGVLTENDLLWNAVLDNLKSQLPATTFYTFVADTQLATLENGVATIRTPRAGALEWLTTRLAKKVKLLLTIEAKIAGKDISITEVRFEVFSEPDENHQA